MPKIASLGQTILKDAFSMIINWTRGIPTEEYFVNFVTAFLMTKEIRNVLFDKILMHFC